MSLMNQASLTTPPTSSFEVLEEIRQPNWQSMPAEKKDYLILSLIRENERLSRDHIKLKDMLTERSKSQKIKITQVILDLQQKISENTKRDEENCALAKHKVNCLEKELENLKEENDKLNLRLTELSEDNRWLTTKFCMADEKVKVLEQEKDELCDRIKENFLEQVCNESTIETHSLNEELISFKNKIYEVEKQLEDERSSKNKLESLNTDITRKNETLKEKIMKLDKKLQSAYEENNSYKQMMDQVAEKNIRLQKTSEKFEAERNELRQTLLNCYEKHSIRGNENIHEQIPREALFKEKSKTGLSEKRESQMAPSADDKAQSPPPCSNQDEQTLMKNIEIISDENTKLKETGLKLKHPEPETKKSEKPSTDGSLGFSKPSNESQEIIIRELEKKLEDLSSKRNILVDENSNLVRDIKSLTKELAELKKQLQEHEEIKAERDTLSAKTHSLLESISEYRMKCENITKESKNKTSKFNGEINTLLNQIRNLKRDIQEKEDIINKLQQEKETKDSLYAKLKQEYEILKSQVNGMISPSNDINPLLRSQRHISRSPNSPPAAYPLLSIPQPTPEWICPICSGKFDDMETLQTHARDCNDFVQDSTASDFHCPVCQKDLGNLQRLQAHVIECGEFN